MKLQKAQLFIAVCGICLGVASMLSIDIVNKNVLHSLTDSIDHITERAALEISETESGFPEKMLDLAAGTLGGWMVLEGFMRLDFGASMTYHVHTETLVLALILSCGLSALAGLYPARRASRTNIVEAVAYE